MIVWWPMNVLLRLQSRCRWLTWMNSLWREIKSVMPVLSVKDKHYRQKQVKSPHCIWVVIILLMPEFSVYVRHYKHHYAKSSHLICVVIRSPMLVLSVYAKHHKHHHIKSTHLIWPIFSGLDFFLYRDFQKRSTKDTFVQTKLMKGDFSECLHGINMRKVDRK